MNKTILKSMLALSLFATCLVSSSTAFRVDESCDGSTSSRKHIGSTVMKGREGGGLILCGHEGGGLRP